MEKFEFPLFFQIKIVYKNTPLVKEVHIDLTICLVREYY